MKLKDIKNYWSFEFSNDPFYFRSCFYKGILVGSYRDSYDGGYLVTFNNPDGSINSFVVYYFLQDVFEALMAFIFVSIHDGVLPPLEE